MSLIVETGSGSAISEAYASVSYADAYHLALGNTAWAALSTSSKEENLRKAATYMCQVYRLRWKGVRVLATQGLDWPRYYVDVPDLGVYTVLPSNSVPVSVQSANAELALLAFTEVLNPNRTQSVISKQVGPIKVVYDQGSPAAKRYTAVDNMLEPLLGSTIGSMNHKLRRC